MPVAPWPDPVRSTGPSSRHPPSTEASPFRSPPPSPSPPLSGLPPLSPFVPPSGSPLPSASIRTIAASICLRPGHHLHPPRSAPSPPPFFSVRTEGDVAVAEREHAVVGVDAATSLEGGAAQYEVRQLGRPPAGQRHRRLLLPVDAAHGRAIKQHMVVAAGGGPPRRCRSYCMTAPRSPAASSDLGLTGLDLGS
jgi:hypothetical protein